MTRVVTYPHGLAQAYCSHCSDWVWLSLGCCPECGAGLTRHVTASVAARFGVTPQQAERGALKLLAAAQQLRRAEIAWNLDSHPAALDVPDLTSHGWPDECGARWVVESADPAHLFPRVFVCTRLPAHTGRHAAGTFTRVAAVWGDAR